MVSVEPEMLSPESSPASLVVDADELMDDPEDDLVDGFAGESGAGGAGSSGAAGMTAPAQPGSVQQASQTEQSTASSYFTSPSKGKGKATQSDFHPTTTSEARTDSKSGTLTGAGRSGGKKEPLLDEKLVDSWNREFADILERKWQRQAS